MIRLSLFPVLLLTLHGALFSQNKLDVFLRDSLDRYTERALTRWQIPGAAICVVKDGKVLVAQGYGVRELGRPERVDANTLFEIGSNTKAFTGTILALLEHDRACSLNDKVQRWLPWFSMRDEWVARDLSLTDILCHRIGMETFQGDFTYWTSDLSSRQVIEKFGLMTPQYGFRSRWGYTNAGFVIAGACTAAISGESWGATVEKRIFKPLDMRRTVAYAADFAKADNIAQPHTVIEGRCQRIPIAMIDNLAPAGSIGSSVNDLSHWAIAQLDDGRYDGREVLPANVIARTRQPRSIIGRSQQPFNKGHYQLYGLGWMLEDYEGREIVSHTGGVNGYVTSVTLVPEEKLGIIVLTNTDENAFFESVKWEILDAALNLPYRDYDRLFHESVAQQEAETNREIAEWRDTVAMKMPPAFELSRYAGRYDNPVYGWIDISVSGADQLLMRFEHHPALSARLECLGGNFFLCTYSDPIMGVKPIHFRTDDKQVTGFTLRVNDFVEFTPYEFVKK
ncbi:MAG TPA: serine hydrolase [Saprospiraceae bacterium]|nr:serine hydrolase [Saprospiraceae bacterium]